MAKGIDMEMKVYAGKLDEMQEKFVTWRKYFDTNSENNLGSVQNIVLHDMSHNCRQAELELHNILDLLIIMGRHNASDGFRRAKLGEVLEKLNFFSRDMLNRSKFSEMSKNLTDNKEISDYLDKMAKAFRHTSGYLKTIETNLKKYRPSPEKK